MGGAQPCPPVCGPQECCRVSLWGVPSSVLWVQGVYPLCVHMGCVCGSLCTRLGVYVWVCE